MPANRVNFRKDYKGIAVRVICPTCGASGGHRMNMWQPKCSDCKDGTLMLPASNSKCECSWEEAEEYVKNSKCLRLK